MWPNLRHRVKFPLRKNGVAASIEISGNPKGPSPTNTEGELGRPIYRFPISFFHILHLAAEHDVEKRPYHVS